MSDTASANQASFNPMSWGGWAGGQMLRCDFMRPSSSAMSGLRASASSGSTPTREPVNQRGHISALLRTQRGSFQRGGKANCPLSELAAVYDEKNADDNAFIGEQIKRHSHEFLGVKQGGRLLDYACGTGLLTDALADVVGQCIGVDVAEEMVNAYNLKAKIKGLEPEQRSAHLGNLVAPAEEIPLIFNHSEFFNLDIVGIGLGFHHFDDPGLAARRLAERLSPGGVLFIFDLLPFNTDARSSAVPTHGFSEASVRKLFEDAGVGSDFRFKILAGRIVTSENGHGHQHGHHHHGHGHSQGTGQDVCSAHDLRRGEVGKGHQVFFARGVKVSSVASVSIP